MSFLRTVGKRKKTRVLGPARVVQRSEYDEVDLDAKAELIRQLIPLGLMHVHELLDAEVVTLAGARGAHHDGAPGTRHGSNPGSVRIAGQQVPIRVPRVRGTAGEMPLQSYATLHGRGEVDPALLQRVLYGVSCRNYEAAAVAIPGAIGLSSSSVSRDFVEASADRLRAFQERDLSGEDIVTLFLDGKTFASSTMVVALGATMSGDKRFLGFVETDTESEKVLSPFLRSLIERGLDVTQGLLVVIDGAKGLRAAVTKVLREHAVVVRCAWHKRENVLRYLPKKDQAMWRRRLQRAYDRPTYAEARAALLALHAELEQLNQSAAASLSEGMEETLTLHRLDVYGVLGRSLKTTNCLESVNALVEERCAKVDSWKNSNQKHRWLATALLDIEPRLRKIKGFKHLPKLREAIQHELKIEIEQTVEEVA
ncbi:MAG: IS256 family transposase [Vicinamibacterales bacterium]